MAIRKFKTYSLSLLEPAYQYQRLAHEEIALMVGPGNTGKSVSNLVEQILGSHNFIGIDLSEIEARFGTGAIYGKD